jgi:plastocyanin
MKRSIITLVFFFSFCLITNAQTTHTINISGFTFSPNDITINVGDTVFFNGSSLHPVLEVSVDTWNAEGNTALSGGFSFPSGVGKIAFNSEGTHYYICENHISSGMKGKINVSTATKLENADILKDIQIYPNPLDGDYLTISNISIKSSPLEIKIYDLTGKIKIESKENTTASQFKIDCYDLSAGIYIVQLKNGNIISSSKLVKK